jgi:hypothetical protein
LKLSISASYITFITASLYACFTSTSSPPSSSSHSSPSSGSVSDSGSQTDETDSSLPLEDAFPLQDMSVSADVADYNPCVNTISQPITSGSDAAQSCLTQQFCIDSTGVVYPTYINDSCNDIECAWQQSCADSNVYCMPIFAASSPEYSSQACGGPIVFAVSPPPKYVSLLGTYPVDTTTAPIEHTCFSVFELGSKWAGDTIPGLSTYYLAYGWPTAEQWGCNSSPPLTSTGLDYYYIGSTDVSTSFTPEL